MFFFTYFRVVNHTPNDCWICHNASDTVVLPITDFCIFNASVLFSPLSIISHSLTVGVHFPAPGYHFQKQVFLNLGSVQRKGQGKVNQNKSICMIYRPLNFTGLHAVTFPVPTDSVKQELSRNSWFNFDFFGQIPNALARSVWTWGYDQEYLLSSSRYCRICC